MLPNFQFYLIYEIFIFWFTALNWKKKTKLECRNWFFDLLCNTVASILLWIEKEIFRSSFCGKISLFLYKQHRFMRTCGFDQIFTLIYLHTLAVFVNGFSRIQPFHSLNESIVAFVCTISQYLPREKENMFAAHWHFCLKNDCICLVQSVNFFSLIT